MRRQDGLSLIATMWIIAILTILATEFLYSTGIERRIDKNFADRTKLFYVAKAGFETALIQLIQDETPYDSLDEDWANPDLQTGQVEDAISPDTALSYRVKITDEATRFNLNTVDEETLARLMLMGYVTDQETANALAAAIVQRRNEAEFRSVGELAEIEGMTREIIYGPVGTEQTKAALESAGTADDQTSSTTVQQTQYSIRAQYGATEDSTETTPIPLFELLTVYSASRASDPNAEQQPVNIATADANEISRISDSDGNTVFTNGEAEAIVAYREANEFKSIFDLLDVPAVSEDVFNQARNRMTTGNNNNNQNNNQVNINQASREELASLPGFDDGIAEDVIRHREQNGNFNSVDQIREVRVTTVDEFKSIASNISASQEEVTPGLINVNTAPIEVLEALPGMDETKAQAIITSRTVSESGGENSGQPFENLAMLMDVEGLDMDTLKQIGPMITCRSDVFRVESFGISSDGKEVGYCMGIVDRTGDRIEIRLWRQR